MFVLSLVKKHYRLQFYMVSGLLSPGLQPEAHSVIDVAACEEVGHSITLKEQYTVKILVTCLGKVFSA